MSLPLTATEQKNIAWLRENTSMTVLQAASRLKLTYYQCYRLIRMGEITMQRKHKDLSADQERWKSYIAENKGMPLADAAKRLGVPYHSLRSFCKGQKIEVERKRSYTRQVKAADASKYFDVEARENWLI